MQTEWEVYHALIGFLQGRGWRILCASPPGGTDSRYQKCIFPRRTQFEKGPRDEVDLIAYRSGVVILAECKVTLEDSLSVLNALGESDKAKLERIRDTLGSRTIAENLRQATRFEVPAEVHVALSLAVARVDKDPPGGFVTIEFGKPVPLIHGMHGIV